MSEIRFYCRPIHLLGSFSHLPALPLQTPDALLMPLGAHSFKRVCLSLFHKQILKRKFFETFELETELNFKYSFILVETNTIVNEQ